MDLFAIGINHNTAPIELREKIAFTPEQLPNALHEVRKRISVREIAILSTCNRTEVYCAADQANSDAIVQWLCDYHHLQKRVLFDSIYQHQGQAVVEHLTRVAAGLDSMMLGEPQILGQVKTAFSLADECGTLGPELARLASTIFRIAKRVRTDTSIGKNPVSVGFATVALATKIFTNLADCNALLIGAGDIIESVAEHLKSQGLTNFVVANRTIENAQELVDRIGGTASNLADIPEHLIDTDIVVASTSSELPILGKGSVERALKFRRHKPIFMVDLAVPRDIEPEVAQLGDVYLYNIDDLREIVNENIKGRQAAAIQAEQIISEAVRDHTREMRALSAVTTITDLRGKFEKIRIEEVAAARKRLETGDDPAAVVDQLATRLTNKMTHAPSTRLKAASADGRDDAIELVRELFELDDPSKP